MSQGTSCRIFPLRSFSCLAQCFHRGEVVAQFLGEGQDRVREDTLSFSLNFVLFSSLNAVIAELLQNSLGEGKDPDLRDERAAQRLSAAVLPETRSFSCLALSRNRRVQHECCFVVFSRRPTKSWVSHDLPVITNRYFLVGVLPTASLLLCLLTTPTKSWVSVCCSPRCASSRWLRRRIASCSLV